MSESKITIPPEALEAALKAWEDDAQSFRPNVETMLIAAINAWPGMWHIKAVDFEGKVILPLPQKKQEPGVFDYWPVDDEYNWGDP